MATPSLNTLRMILYPVVLIGFIIALANGFGIFRSPTLDEQLRLAARHKNESLPRPMENDRRLDFVSASQGGILTYHFTLLERNRRDIDAEALAAQEIPHLHNLYQEDAWTDLREKGVEVRYEYADAASVPFLLISTHAEQPLPLPVPETPRNR